MGGTECQEKWAVGSVEAHAGAGEGCAADLEGPGKPLRVSGTSVRSSDLCSSSPGCRVLNGSWGAGGRPGASSQGRRGGPQTREESGLTRVHRQSCGSSLNLSGGFRRCVRKEPPGPGLCGWLRHGSLAGASLWAPSAAGSGSSRLGAGGCPGWSASAVVAVETPTLKSRAFL